MKYIIMCGGQYYQNPPRQLLIVNGERIVSRTIRLLQENGVTDIAISSNNEMFEGLGVPVIHHNNRFDAARYYCTWIDAFYPTQEPACYIMGDVYFSEQAIKEIVETETNTIEFFASAPPFAREYIKVWGEPFAFKVQDQEMFQRCIRIVKEYYIKNKWNREPIAWELWQIIKGTRLNEVDYTNYHAINDYTVDVDNQNTVKRLEEVLCRYQ